MKSWLIGKDSDAGKGWKQEKGTTEDEMVGWHHRLNGHEFGSTPGVGDGQGGLAGCSSWGCKESDWVTELNPDFRIMAKTVRPFHSPVQLLGSLDVSGNPTQETSKSQLFSPLFHHLIPVSIKSLARAHYLVFLDLITGCTPSLTSPTLPPQPYFCSSVF